LPLSISPRVIRPYERLEPRGKENRAEGILALGESQISREQTLTKEHVFLYGGCTIDPFDRGFMAAVKSRAVL
jgi:hypothetical protein